MTVFFRLFLSIIVAVPRVQSQALKCNDSSCVGHARDVTVLDRSTSTTVWIAPDDVIVDRIPEQNAFPCPGSNLIAVVKQALRLTTCQVILCPFCLEGLILVKTPVSVLVDLKGPTYCALVVSTSHQRHSLRSRRVHQSNCKRYFGYPNGRSHRCHRAAPPKWDKTLQLDGPSFTGLRGRVEGMRFVALMVAGRLVVVDFFNVSAVVLRNLVAGFDRPAVAISKPWLTDLWQDMDARVLARLRQTVVNSASVTPTCPLASHSASHSTTLIVVAFCLVALLATCVIILLVHSCRTTEAEDLALYRAQDAPLQDRAKPTLPTTPVSAVQIQTANRHNFPPSSDRGPLLGRYQ